LFKTFHRKRFQNPTLSGVATRGKFVR